MHLPWINICSNLQYYDQPYYLEKHMDLLNDIFTFVFIVELFIKLLALRAVSFQVSRLLSTEIFSDTLIEGFLHLQQWLLLCKKFIFCWVVKPNKILFLQVIIDFVVLKRGVLSRLVHEVRSSMTSICLSFYISFFSALNPNQFVYKNLSDSLLISPNIRVRFWKCEGCSFFLLFEVLINLQRDWGVSRAWQGLQEAHITHIWKSYLFHLQINILRENHENLAKSRV